MLGIRRDSLIIGISLMLMFIVAALTMPIHIKIGQKIGMRNAFILSLLIWMISLFPFVLLGEGMFIIALFVSASVGFGLSGNLFFFDILMGDVIDQDELIHGVKRSASFYGTNAFFHRLHILLLISTITLIFTGTGWAGYDPNPGVDVIIGLKLLIFLFPAIALIIAILFLKSYDLHGDKLAKMREEIQKKGAM
ncbi:MAG: MFS transporter [Promethearchaeota archaeon]